MPELPTTDTIATATTVTFAAAAKLASTTAIALGRCNMKADQIMLPSNSHSRASALARKLDLVD